MQPKSITIVVIPAEGCSAETMQWYIKEVEDRYHYLLKQGTKLNVCTLDCEQSRDTWAEVNDFFYNIHSTEIEIHAQGGLGAYTVARVMYFCHLYKVKRVFFIGGAPSKAMTLPAKIFYRWFLRRKYRSGMLIHQNPDLYYHQLQLIGNWRLPPDWQKEIGDCVCWFIPNGTTSYLQWNGFNNYHATRIWRQYGVTTTERPKDTFDFRSLTPAKACLEVMDTVRTL